MAAGLAKINKQLSNCKTVLTDFMVFLLNNHFNPVESMLVVTIKMKTKIFFKNFLEINLY